MSPSGVVTHLPNVSTTAAYAGPPRPPLKSLNKDDKRQLDQVVRVLKRTVAEIEAE